MSELLASQLAGLKKIFTPEQMSLDPQDRLALGKDWTNYFNINASAIVFPESTEQVQKLVHWARKEKVGLVPSGGRTGLSGGACALHGEIVVSLARMNKILGFDKADACVLVQAGVVTKTLQEFAKQQGLSYPVDFAASGSSQIGGNIATNAGGIKVLRYGLTRDWVAGLKVVTGTGEILNLNRSLVKNATGYDLRHLFIGSEGTLGLVTEASIRLAPAPPPLQVLVLAVPSLDSIMQVFAEMRSHCTLTAFEMFSDLALKHVIKKTGLQSPLSASAPYYLVCEIEAASESAQSQILEVFESLLEKGLVSDGALSQSDTQAKSFWRLREDISESLSSFSPYKNDISVRISRVPALILELDPLLGRAYPDWEVVWFGHIGDGNLHINILRPPHMSKEDFVKACQKVDDLIFTAVQNQEGSISAEHGVGLTKKPFLHFTRSPEEIRLMQGMKALFDPDGIMNPGKLVDASANA